MAMINYMVIFLYLFSSTFASRLPPFITMSTENHQLALKNIDSTLYCNSWRNAVESNAAVDPTVPAACTDFVRAYMNSNQYKLDSKVIADYALAFAKTVNVTERDAWIFDIDDTLLSTVPYFTAYGYGLKTFNKSGAFKASEFPSDLHALPASLTLYKKLQRLGFKIFLLTGRSESIRTVTEKNLQDVGYSNWEKLIMREACEEDKPAVIYKSEKRAELEYEGYTIQGSSGDQWSDLLGFAMAKRSFKLPNLMYYLA